MNELQEAAANLLRVQLQTFLSRNPEADVKAGENEPSVSGPWGDESIEIPMPTNDNALIEALNTVRLPPRFTAIWHENTKEFEVIYMVLTKDSHVLERHFVYHYRDNTYECSFAPSSPTLRAIARTARPSGKESRSGFRNLQPFYRFERTIEEHPESAYAKNGHPTSFWIRGLDDFDDDYVSDLLRNLNFHMTYFDRHSPVIIIHEEYSASHQIDEQQPPQFDQFPETVAALPIDQHLLILWESARRGDPFLSFIHYYQILEYAGFYYVKNDIRRNVQRALAAPDAASRPERTAQRIMDAMSIEKRHDNEKMNAMIGECVNPEDMWDVLEEVIGGFSKEVRLDGGFTLPAIVSAPANYEQFVGTWNSKFLPALHQIRNALVHARESRQAATIAPTTANRERLQPWLLPLSQTAAQVMLYRQL